MPSALLRLLVPVLAAACLLAEDVPAPTPASTAEVPAPKARAERKPSADARPALFVNVKVSTRTAALNQPVRVEFFTPARQIDNLDIAAAITGGVAMSAGPTWRLVGKPTVTENEKIRSVTVAFTLLPRISGDLALPRFPLTWLAGEPLPDLGQVKVEPGVLVAGEKKPLPREVEGVGGLPWGVALKDVLGKEIKGEQVEAKGEISIAKPRPGLELTFRGGDLAEALLTVEDLKLEQAEASFIERWGVPQVALDDGRPAWLLGWTRIDVQPREGGGVILHLVREDVLARAAAGQVRGRVFDLLEGNR
jgi:hypothetical protein